MKKILIGLCLILFVTNLAFSGETKCADFKKLSKEYLKCNTDKIKKGTIKKTKEVKQGTADKTKKLKQSVKKFTNKLKNKIKKKE